MGSKLNSSKIRQAFLEYFAERGHTIVPSSSLVPKDDPTLLFTNAGMVQFKDVFLGFDKRPYTQAVSVQKCVRAGGKHNDLENVGYTARHHTFFEMLGNFSFGDYFKREAIEYAWEFLTKVLKLPEEKLWVTVYKDDTESRDIWLNEIGVSKDRFSFCGEKDNFWQMGDVGPCGPCTEIFYDHGESVAGGPPGSEDEDGDRYVEIWNLVFMQYNRDPEGNLHPLPKPAVDTGMGLERITAVVEKVHDNYDTDLFKPLMQAVIKFSNNKIDANSNSLKVIADHIRSSAFLISDGVIPGNEGRGYVLRRIIRRAVRHGHKNGLPMPFFYSLVDPLVEIMGQAYPQLVENSEYIEKIIREEEKNFSRTIETGLSLLKEAFDDVENKIIPGEIVFKLYDTYGFPVDLTQDIAREHGLEVDIAGFKKCMDLQKLQSKAKSTFQGSAAKAIDLKESSEFLGYEKNISETSILAIIVDDKKVNKIGQKTKGALILKETPFYPEGGGQVGDIGEIKCKQNLFNVTDTKKNQNAIVHYGEVVKGEFNVNDTVTAEVDDVRRDYIRLNHTATHLLHAALQKYLGSHVKQQGSLVEAHRARFDFTHHKPLTKEEILQIETLVNYRIRLNEPVETAIMSLQDAKKSKAQALFGEKYDEKVRVLSIGDFSKELCGGTHAGRTGDIGLFKIVAEYGIASGVRRIEMLTGPYALTYVNENLNALDNAAQLLKTKPKELAQKITELFATLKEKEKEILGYKQKLAAKSGEELQKEIKKIGNINLLIKQIENKNNNDLRIMLDGLKNTINSSIVILYTVAEGNLFAIAGISKDIVGKVPKAKEFVVTLTGKGGGRDDMAQGGGPVPQDINERIKKIANLIQDFAN